MSRIGAFSENLSHPKPREFYHKYVVRILEAEIPRDLGHVRKSRGELDSV